MKKTFLTLFFAIYYFFMPFVMVNCQVKDNPYALNETAAASTSLEVCQQMDYVVAECVQILQQEEERIQEEKEAVLNAEAVLSDFITCQSSFTSPTADTATTEEISETDATEIVETLDCPTIVQGISEADVICALLEDDAKYEGCDNVEEAVADALANCETDETMEASFCSALSGV